MRIVRYYGKLKVNDYIRVVCRGNICYIGQIIKIDSDWMIFRGIRPEYHHLEIFFEKDGLIKLHNQIVKVIYKYDDIDELRIELI